MILLFASHSLFSQEAKAIFSHPEFVEGFNITAKKGYNILEIKPINTLDTKTPQEQFVLVHRDSIALIDSLEKQYKNINCVFFCIFSFFLFFFLSIIQDN